MYTIHTCIYNCFYIYSSIVLALILYHVVNSLILLQDWAVNEIPCCTTCLTVGFIQSLTFSNSNRSVTIVHCYFNLHIPYDNCGEGNGTPLQYSCLENPMDGGAWKAAVHGVAKSWTWLRDFTFTFHFHALEKEMATHSSVLAWWIPGKGEPGGLQSLRSHRVIHDWSDLVVVVVVWQVMLKFSHMLIFHLYTFFGEVFVHFHFHFFN